MIFKIKRYTIVDGNMDTVLSAITEFLDGIRRHEAEIRYDAYRIKGTTSFIHFMSFPTELAEQHHRNAPHTRKFVEVVYPLCKEQPVITDLDKIEGMLGGEYE